MEFLSTSPRVSFVEPGGLFDWLIDFFFFLSFHRGNCWAPLKDRVATSTFKFRYRAYATGRPPTTPSSSSDDLSLVMDRRAGDWRVFPFNRLGLSVLAGCPGRTGFPACTQRNAIWTLTLIRLGLLLVSAKEQPCHKVKRQGCFILARFLSLCCWGTWGPELGTFIIMFSSK